MNPTRHETAVPRGLRLLGAGLAALALTAGAFAQDVDPPRVRTAASLMVQATAGVPSLVCAKVGIAPRPGGVPVPARPAEPTQIPDAAEVEAALAARPSPGARSGGDRSALARARPGQPYRVALWGDSHLAAGYFSEELARLLGSPGGRPLQPQFIAAGIGHVGVRGLVRKTCLSAGWKHEPAYAVAAAAAAPGPGLVSLVASERSAALAVDLRDAAGQPLHSAVRVLYHQPETPLVVGLSIDDGPETAVGLSGPAGPAAIDLQADGPMSTLRLRLISGSLRLQGLRLMGPLPWLPPAEIDVFAFPGATAAGWQRAQGPYLRSWFRDSDYDLTVLAFGTNEGNAQGFDAATYREGLFQAIGAWRQTFPNAQCVLVSPGDRGVRVKAVRKPAGTGRKAAATPSTELLRYSLVHAQIARIQAEVASEFRCKSWNAQAAMGGLGSAYRWARQNPPLMAADLLHFTAAGYRELARLFAADLGWDERLLSPR